MRTLLYQASTMDWRFASPPKFICWVYICMWLCLKQSFWEAIRPWALTRVIKIFIREAERDPCSTTMWRYKKIPTVCNLQEGSHQTQSAGILTLDFPAFETMGKKFWCFKLLFVVSCSSRHHRIRQHQTPGRDIWPWGELAGTLEVGRFYKGKCQNPWSCHWTAQLANPVAAVLLDFLLIKDDKSPYPKATWNQGFYYLQMKASELIYHASSQIFKIIKPHNSIDIALFKIVFKNITSLLSNLLYKDRIFNPFLQIEKNWKLP